MDIKKLSKKLMRAKEIIFKQETPLTETEKQLIETLSLEPFNIKNEDFDVPMAQNDNNILTADQHYRLRLMEKTGTGSRAIH